MACPQVPVCYVFCLGMSFGLFLSAVCTTENSAIQVAIAVFYPNMMLSGELGEGGKGGGERG